MLSSFRKWVCLDPSPCFLGFPYIGGDGKTSVPNYGDIDNPDVGCQMSFG